MHHIPKPQDQARILEAALKSLDIHLPHQDALQVIAKVMGHKDWKTMSAASKKAAALIKAPPVVAPESAAAFDNSPEEIMGPEDGDLYEALMTVDVSESARIRVRAYDEEEARELLREAAQAQYPRGFTTDENYRGGCDFYMGDSDALENLSKPEIESEGDHFGRADWKDERFSYKILMSRPNSDSSDEDDWAEVEVTLVVSDENGASVRQVITDYEVHSDDLGEWIEECIENGDFEDELDALVKKLEQQLSLK